MNDQQKFMELLQQKTTIIVMALLFIIGLISCQTTNPQGTSIIDQQKFVETLQQMKKSATNDGSIALSDITNFEWEQVCLFPEGAKYEDVNQLIGLSVYSDDGRVWDDNQLLVFINKGEVVFRTLVPDLIYSNTSLQYWSRKGICIPKANAVLRTYDFESTRETMRILLLPPEYVN